MNDNKLSKSHFRTWKSSDWYDLLQSHTSQNALDN